MITPKQIGIMAHALGGDKRYRNHYCLDEGGDGWDDIQNLINGGYMIKGYFDTYSGMHMFHVTDAGIMVLDMMDALRAQAKKTAYFNGSNPQDWERYLCAEARAVLCENIPS